jgi:uncharacterized protein YjbI with pentapeptide repeats
MRIQISPRQAINLFGTAEMKRAAQAVVDAPTEGFVELVRIAGLSPQTDMVGGDWRNVDFKDQDLAGFDFTSSDMRGCKFDGALVDKAVFASVLMDNEATESLTRALQDCKRMNDANPNPNDT